MRDIGKWPAVKNRGITLQRLHQIGLNRLGE